MVCTKRLLNENETLSAAERQSRIDGLGVQYGDKEHTLDELSLPFAFMPSSNVHGFLEHPLRYACTVSVACLAFFSTQSPLWCDPDLMALPMRF